MAMSALLSSYSGIAETNNNSCRPLTRSNWKRGLQLFYLFYGFHVVGKWGIRAA